MGGKSADVQKKDGGKSADGQKKGGKKAEKVKPRVKSDLVLARADVNSTDFLNVMEYLQIYVKHKLIFTNFFASIFNGKGATG